MLARANPEKMLSLFDEPALQAMDNMIEATQFRHAITEEIAILGPGIVRALNNHNIKIKSVANGQRFAEVSKSLATLGVKMQPGTQGFYVPFDKALYIIEPMPGVIVHELGHALDAIMADTSSFDHIRPEDVAGPMTKEKFELLQNYKPFRTLQDQEFLNHVKGNTWAPSAYGSTSPQEFFAEAVRAYCNVNDTGSLFDEISAPKFRCMNRESFGYFLSIFHKYNGRAFEKWRHSESGITV